MYYWRMDGERLEILRELVASVVPLGVLTFVVLAVILFGITTATESAAVGALGALYLAALSKRPRQVWWWSLGGLIVGLALGSRRGDAVTMIVSGALGAVFLGTVVPWLATLRSSPELRQSLKESTFLTAKTRPWSAGSSRLGAVSAVVALHGGRSLIDAGATELSPEAFS